MDSISIKKLVSDGVDQSKAGDAADVYKSVVDIYPDGNLPTDCHYAFGWITYYALHQSEEHAIIERKKMLANYLRLNVPMPHKLHSMILTEAIRLYHDAKKLAFNLKDNAPKFSVVKFLKLWGIQNLRPGDWRRKEFNGRLQSSTVERLVTVCVNEYEESRLLPDKEFLNMIDHCLEQYPDSFNILSQRAILHSMAGEGDRASNCMRNAILLSPNKYYLWQRYAEMTDPAANPHLHVALLYKALSAPGPENYKGRVRLALASALASRGAFPQALWEIERVKNVYSSNNWHFPRVLQRVAEKIPSGTVMDNPERLYRKVEHLADAEVYNVLCPIKAVKTFHKNPAPSGAGKTYGRPMVAWRVTDNDGNSLWFNPERMNINPDFPIGTEVLVRVFNGRIVKAEISVAQQDAATPAATSGYAVAPAGEVEIASEPIDDYGWPPLADQASAESPDEVENLILYSEV